jgi:hypothetical protein
MQVTLRPRQLVSSALSAGTAFRSNDSFSKGSQIQSSEDPCVVQQMMLQQFHCDRVPKQLMLADIQGRLASSTHV